MPLNLIHGVAVVEVDEGVRPITLARTGVIGLAGVQPDASDSTCPVGTPFLVRSLSEALSVLGVGSDPSPDGNLVPALRAIYAQASGALVVMVRDADGVPEGLGTTAAEAFLAAESVVGVKPRILCALIDAPSASNTNGLLTALSPAAKRLRATIILDGPSDAANPLATASTWAEAITGERDRMYAVAPQVQAGGTLVLASPYVAGLIARMDNERGFWWSPSNQRINGIAGTAFPVDFALGDSSSLADLLNGQHIATIIRKDGFRLWGNRTLEKTDPKWRFLSVRRIADILNDTLLENHLWAVDRNITRTYLENVTDGVNAFIRQLQAQGAILGGRCLPNPDLNTPESIASGHVHFDFEFTPATPAEKITFRSALVNDYIEEIL